MYDGGFFGIAEVKSWGPSNSETSLSDFEMGTINFEMAPSSPLPFLFLLICCLGCDFSRGRNTHVGDGNGNGDGDSGCDILFGEQIVIQIWKTNNF